MFEKIACNSKCKLTCKSQKTLSALCLSLCHVQLLGPNPLCLSKLSLFCISIIFFFFLPLIYSISLYTARKYKHLSNIGNATQARPAVGCLGVIRGEAMISEYVNANGYRFRSLRVLISTLLQIKPSLGIITQIAHLGDSC